jgi:hypothetical protein
MNRSVVMAFTTLACFTAWAIVFDSPSGLGQRPVSGTSGIRGARGELGSRISGERTTRQVEVLRLQDSIDRLQSRVQRLERAALSGGAFPAFTIEESEAELAFAEAQLAERLRDQQDGNASEVQVAADRLRLVRARSQLTLARAAHVDRKLALQTEVADARRKLIEESQQEQQLQRLVAKGYASAEGWELQQIDVEVAKKLLLRAQSRLEVYEQLDKPKPLDKPQPADAAGEAHKPVPGR